MNFLTLLGVVLLAITYWDYRKEETDTVFILDWWAWFDVSRASFPLLYWLIILAQIVGGITLIFYGFKNG